MRAEGIAGALSGRKAGGGWMARCPAHEIASRACRSTAATVARCWSVAMLAATSDR
jgi:hypothetical protein